jgi:protein-tyrosine phosphatase
MIEAEDLSFWPEPVLESRRAERGPVFRVLFVCTGNISRSPLAEEVLRQRLAAWGGNWAQTIALDSAGTGAVQGADMDPESQIQLSRLGFAPQAKPHVAKQVTAAIVRTADLILAMTHRHRKEILRLRPKAKGRTFVLPEFAALAQADNRWFTAIKEAGAYFGDADENPARPLRHGVIDLDAERTTVHHGEDKHSFDIEDPFRQPTEVYAEVADQIVGAINQAFPPVAPA